MRIDLKTILQRTVSSLYGDLVTRPTGQAVRGGIAYLLQAERDGGKWHEEYFNAVGFPRVFYLRYHWYCQYFPLWALAMYRNLRSRGHMRADELRLHVESAGSYRFDR